MKKVLDRIIDSLNRVTVSGKDNHALLYNSIDALEKLRGMIRVETREIEPEEENGDDHQDEQGENDQSAVGVGACQRRRRPDA